MKKQTKLALMALLVVLVLSCVVGLVACDKTAEDVISRYILPQAEQLLTEDFTLPKTIGSEDKLVEVTWTSSNTNAIQIVDGGAEYTAKVTIQDDVTEVTLTISSGKASKSFNVRVDGFSVYTFTDNFTFPQRGTAVTDSFDLQTEFTYLGKKATITWEVHDKASQAFLSVTGNNRCEVTLPDDDITSVKLRATFAYNGETAPVDYSFSVSPIFEHRQIVQRYYSVTDYPLELSGYIVYINEVSASYGNATFWMIDDDYCSGYYIYRGKIDKTQVDKFVVGAHVTFTGDKTKNYNDLWENNSGGTATVDDKTPINPRDHVYSFDADLISGIGSAIWHESTYVSLSGWKVKDIPETKPTGSDTNLATLTRDGLDITVRISKYVFTDDKVTELTAMLDVYDTLKAAMEKGDVYVNITGLLGNFNAFQIQPVSANDITIVEQEGSCLEGTALKTAVSAVKTAVTTNFSSLVTTHKEVDMPVSSGDVTISYRLAGEGIKNPTVTIENGKFIVEPVATKRNYDIEVTYTVNGQKYYDFFKLPNQKLDDQGIVDKVAEDLRAVTVDPIKQTGDTDLPKVDNLGAKITWAVKGETPDWLALTSDKLTINALPDEDTDVTLVATITLNGKTATAEITYTVKAASDVTFVQINEPTPGEYIFGLYQGKVDKWLYSTGTIESSDKGNFGATTENYASAATYVIAGNETDGYTIQLKSDNTYFELDSDHRICYVAESTATWKWDETYKVFTFTVGDVTYYVGTYNTFETFSASNVSYLSNASNFPAHFGKMGATPDPDPEPGPEPTPAPDAPIGTLLATFNLGENVTTGEHSDGGVTSEGVDYKVAWDLTKNGEFKYTVGSFTLNFTDISQFYPYANDKVGNSSIKLGSGKATGGFTITVGDDVQSVVFYVAGYKGNDGKVTVNGVEYEVVKHSDDGEYVQVIVDTRTNKTVVFSTTSSATRAMLNTIELYGNASTPGGGGSIEPAKHECKHVCETCGGCTSDCTDPVCTAKKCPGHDTPPAAHVCGHVCETCGGCTSDCTDPVCTAKKCLGHDTPPAAHVCGHVCKTCEGCTSDCTDPVCTAKKCPGHNDPADDTNIINITSTTLPFEKGYNEEEATGVLNGVTFGWVQSMRNTYDGKDAIQFSGSKGTLFYTKTALPKAIKEIHLVMDGTNSYGSENVFTIFFATSYEGLDTAPVAQQVVFDTEADVTEYTITAPEGEWTFIKFQAVDSHATYWKSIELRLEGASSGTTPGGGGTDPAHQHVLKYEQISGTTTHKESCTDPACPDHYEATVNCTPVENVCPCGHEFTVEEILAALDKLKAEGSYGAQETLPGTYKLKGLVTGVSSTTIYMDVNGHAIQAYQIKDGKAKVAEAVVGCKVTVVGTLADVLLKVNTKEFVSCTLEAIENVEYDITWNVEQNGNIVDKPAKANAGETVTFTISCTEGYKVAKVLVNGSILVAKDDGSYEFVVTGAMTVEVKIVSNDTKLEEELFALTFGSEVNTNDDKVNGYNTDWTATRGSNSWRIINFNNYDNKWTFIKCGHKTNAYVATITNTNAFTQEITSVVVNMDSVDNDKTKAFKLEVSTNADFAEKNIVETIELDEIKVDDNIFTLSQARANCYFRITIDCDSASSNGFNVLNSVTYYGYPA